MIKNFEKVRSKMRDFYIYGFKRRDEFDSRNVRIYDDEYRRVKGTCPLAALHKGCGRL